MYNEKTTEDISKTLVQYYKAFGYNLIKVTSSIKVNNDNRINIYFDIEEGEITKIYKINIIGNESFSLRKIKLITADSIGAKATITNVFATFVFSIEITNTMLVMAKVRIKNTPCQPLSKIFLNKLDL